MNIKREKNTFFDIKIIKTFADSKIIPTFASAFEKNSCSIKSRIRFSDDGAKKKMQKFLKKRFGGLKKITYLCSPKRDEKNHGSFEIGSLNYW